MVVRLSALQTGRLYSQEILLVLISVRGSVDRVYFKLHKMETALTITVDGIENRKSV